MIQLTEHESRLRDALVEMGYANESATATVKICSSYMLGIADVMAKFHNLSCQSNLKLMEALMAMSEMQISTMKRVDNISFAVKSLIEYTLDKDGVDRSKDAMEKMKNSLIN